MVKTFTALLSICVLALSSPRWMYLTPYSQGYGCCASLQWVAPSLGMLVLAIKPEGADVKRWRRDFVLALEKRRTKRRARLAAAAPVCNLSMYRVVSHRNVQNGCQK